MREVQCLYSHQHYCPPFPIDGALHWRRSGNQHDHFVPTQPPQNHCLHAMGGFRLMIKSCDCSTIFFYHWLLMQRCCVLLLLKKLVWIGLWCVFWFCMVLVGNVTCSKGGVDHQDRVVRVNSEGWGNLWILVSTRPWLP